MALGVQPVLHLVPQRRLLERPLHRLGQLAPGTACCSTWSPAATLSKIDIVGKGVGFWNTMPDPAPQLHRVDARRVDVLAVEQHPAR